MPRGNNRNIPAIGPKNTVTIDARSLARARELRAAGMTWSDIARRWGTSIQTLRTRLRSGGIGLKRQPDENA